eukprot:1146305-Pelagomonas_calceolata.AAC.1
MQKQKPTPKQGGLRRRSCTQTALGGGATLGLWQNHGQTQREEGRGGPGLAATETAACVPDACQALMPSSHAL